MCRLVYGELIPVWQARYSCPQSRSQSHRERSLELLATELHVWRCHLRSKGGVDSGTPFLIVGAQLSLAATRVSVCHMQ
jgi:hypothetical protein